MLALVVTIGVLLSSAPSRAEDAKEPRTPHFRVVGMGLPIPGLGLGVSIADRIDVDVAGGYIDLGGIGSFGYYQGRAGVRIVSTPTRIEDLIAGAPNLGVGGTQPGGAFLYRGSATSGLQSTPTVSLTSPTTDAYGHLGNSVAIPGDFDGDGRADAVVAGTDIDGSSTMPRSGAVFVYLGTASGLATPAAVRIDMPAKMKGTAYGSELLP